MTTGKGVDSGIEPENSGDVKNMPHQARELSNSANKELDSNPTLYSDDVLSQFAAFISTGATQMEEKTLNDEISESEVSQLESYSQYLENLHYLFHIRKALLLGEIEHPLPLENADDMDNLEATFRGYEKTVKASVGLVPKQLAEMVESTITKWTSGRDLALTIVVPPANKADVDNLLKNVEQLQDGLALYKANSPQAFLIAAFIKAKVEISDKNRDMLQQTIDCLNGSKEKMSEESEELVEAAKQYNFQGVKEAFSKKKTDVATIVSELGRKENSFKKKLYLTQQLRALSLEDIGEKTVNEMGASGKAYLERVAIAIIINENAASQFEDVVVHMFTRGSQDEETSWKAGLLLATHVPQKESNLRKIKTYCNKAFRKSQKSKWYRAFNVVQKGKYPELTKKLLNILQNGTTTEEFQVLIVKNAKILFGEEWEDILKTVRDKTESPLLKEIIDRIMSGTKEKIRVIDIDLEKRKDRIKGALFGFAIGDTIGTPIECLNLDQIREKYGVVDDYVEYEFQTLPLGEYSDDTRMTMMVMDQIMSDKNFDPYTMEEEFAKEARSIDHEEDFDRHYSLKTKMAMRRMSIGQDWRLSGNDSDKNGAAIRSLPLAILAMFDEENSLKKNVEKASVPTHNNPLGVEGAFLTALASKYIMECDSFEIEKLLDLLEENSKHPEMRKKLSQLRELLASDTSFSEAQEILGDKSRIVETLPYALFCFLKNPYNYKDVLVGALNINGDSDSIAAIAGSFCGALVGYSKLPEKWVDQLSCKERLEKYFK